MSTTYLEYGKQISQCFEKGKQNETDKTALGRGFRDFVSVHEWSHRKTFLFFRVALFEKFLKQNKKKIKNCNRREK